MSRREKWLAIVVGALVGLFALDRLVIAPLTARYDELQTRKTQLHAQLQEARALVDREDRIESRRQSYRAAGLAADAEAARARVQQELAGWSSSTGLALETLSTGRVMEGEQFEEITFVVSGVGSLQSVQQFLWHVTQAPFPLRIVECDLVSRVETDDRLSLSMRLSTVVESNGGNGGQS